MEKLSNADESKVFLIFIICSYFLIYKLQAKNQLIVENTPPPPPPPPPSACRVKINGIIQDYLQHMITVKVPSKLVLDELDPFS